MARDLVEPHTFTRSDTRRVTHEAACGECMVGTQMTGTSVVLAPHVRRSTGPPTMASVRFHYRMCALACGTPPLRLTGRGSGTLLQRNGSSLLILVRLDGESAVAFNENMSKRSVVDQLARIGKLRPLILSRRHTYANSWTSGLMMTLTRVANSGVPTEHKGAQ